MQILLIAATEHEIRQELIANSGVDLLITGVGCPATLYHLQKRLQQIDYDMVIQAGIAGTFNDLLKPGQTALVKEDGFGDLGTEEKEEFMPIFKTGLAGENDFPFEKGRLVNTHPVLDLSALPKVNAITVNKVSDSMLQKQQLLQHFDPQLESMEGAALHYVCLQEKIPFVQIRSVSNTVGERDRSKWKMREAIEALNHELLSLVSLARLWAQ